MKTELTRDIERCLSSYDPAKMELLEINKFRPRHTFFEFPAVNGTTEGGLIDVVKIAEYFLTTGSHGGCIFSRELKKYRTIPGNCNLGLVEGDEAPDRCEKADCHCNIRVAEKQEHILFACYEIKISRADFLSPNGHNFCGNLNYYVMPREVYDQCKKDIPAGIGAIIYWQGEFGGCLRRVKSSEYKELSDTEQKWFLMAALKKHLKKAKELARKERVRSRTLIGIDFREEEAEQ